MSNRDVKVLSVAHDQILLRHDHLDRPLLVLRLLLMMIMMWLLLHRVLMTNIPMKRIRHRNPCIHCRLPWRILQSPQILLVITAVTKMISKNSEGTLGGISHRLLPSLI